MPGGTAGFFARRYLPDNTARFNARFGGRTEKCPLAAFVRAKMPETDCFSACFSARNAWRERIKSDGRFCRNAERTPIRRSLAIKYREK